MCLHVDTTLTVARVAVSVRSRPFARRRMLDVLQFCDVKSLGALSEWRHGRDLCAGSAVTPGVVACLPATASRTLRGRVESFGVWEGHLRRAVQEARAMGNFNDANPHPSVLHMNHPVVHGWSGSAARLWFKTHTRVIREVRRVLVPCILCGITRHRSPLHRRAACTAARQRAYQHVATCQAWRPPCQVRQGITGLS